MIRNIARGAALAAAFTGVAAGALAMQPPNPDNAQSVLDWSAREKISAVTTDPAGSWQPLGADQAFLMMGGILATKDAGGIAKVGVRMEFFAPTDVGAGVPALSQALLFDADCARNTIKLTSQAAYRERNLGGVIGQAAASDPAEPVAGHPLAETVQQACAARPAAPVVAAAPPSVNYQDRNALNSFVQRNVQTSAGGLTWTDAGALPPGPIYRAIDSRNSESRTNRRVRVRLERFDSYVFDGMTVRSEVTDYDLNCLRNEARRVSVTVYERHNLSGQAKVTNATVDEYKPVAEVGLINAMAQDICREMDRTPNF